MAAMKKPGSADDPLWYKDAVIYELHVRTFFDANSDGIGDFQGLVQRLDYLSDLGVTCLWLLPFFPSPLRDDGYDIADYCNVHASYGTLDDFREFLDQAHKRGMQVLIELVINHTSDQHQWFQRARKAPAGSPERDFYVWSDTDDRYQGVRIIFTDTEKSNWTWDPEAKAYYWHRFFSHQPDLNFDNPEVVAEIVRVMRFWLDMGVDALRFDAIPYLVERDGTNCENLPETHAVIKQLRAELDAEHASRMILAEANQMPSDVCSYFGDGDECHMAFHFPLMPRLFMGLRLEDRHPVTDIMQQTPNIPPTCQWGLFLRNHDELTLEMVTSEERDYMYLAYSADPRMRINVGIRRRLAPLLENNRRRIELLASVLLSFPGTPILYYGDEIGMGDNIYLGDRNAVRTPMQWSPDRNGGFSRANPAKLYSPVIMDPVFGYEVVNVEAQEGDSSSLLNWTKRMIALRKLFKVFGRGSIEFLDPSNRKILAYVRQFGDERVLCVANLSRFAQPLELDLASLAGTTPVEMLGYVEFPRIGRSPYPLTLGPYGFLWFELHGQPESLLTYDASDADVPALTLPATAGWEAPFLPDGQSLLESCRVPAFLSKQRWFAGKARQIRSCAVEDWIPLSSSAGLAMLTVEYTDDGRETYVVALAFSAGPFVERLRDASPTAILCGLTVGSVTGVVHDALASDDQCRALFALLTNRTEERGANGTITGFAADEVRAQPTPDGGWPVGRMSGEQSNSSLALGDRFILKLFRHLEYGPNPDYEMTRYLSESRKFDGVPSYAGHLEYRRPVSGSATVAFAESLVSNQGDGWVWMLDELGRYYERAPTLPAEDFLSFAREGSILERAEMDFPPGLDEALGISDDAAAALGRRTAQMHLALAEPTSDQAFVPEAMQPADMKQLAAQLQEHASQVFARLRDALATLPDEVVESASRVLSTRSRIARRLGHLSEVTPHWNRIRIHGDFHLGQVLRAANEFVVIDFEGEPARPLSQRRAKQSALKDVAGMLRSFSYAAQFALVAHVSRRPAGEERLQPWQRLWERSVHAAFLRAYRQTAGAPSYLPADQAEFGSLLEAFLFDKALYELRYELDNRPSWVRVPLAGILDLEFGQRAEEEVA
jgi:maltose alpha-D-glucosyltransferase / alpha-amylase